jgi:hypothetical protein
MICLQPAMHSMKQRIEADSFVDFTAPAPGCGRRRNARLRHAIVASH